MSTGTFLEVLLTSFIITELLYLFTLHYTALTVLLLNEKENRKILAIMVVSDRYISHDISVIRLGWRTNNFVDCRLLSPEPGLYLRCGDVEYGNREGKLVIRRLVVDRNKPTYFEVGIS